MCFNLTPVLRLHYKRLHLKLSSELLVISCNKQASRPPTTTAHTENCGLSQGSRPQGEEQLENWVEQARLMIEECQRPEREKKMRIMESVKGPALEVLQAVRFNDPNATSIDYLDILENTFGTPESGEELYFAFRMLCQHSGEKLSEFLRHMERVLNKVVQKGGLQASTTDKARLDQLIKGATRSDLMILNLRAANQESGETTHPLSCSCLTRYVWRRSMKLHVIDYIPPKQFMPKAPL